MTDLVNLYDSAVKNIGKAAGQVFNAGGGAKNTLSLLELLEMLGTALGHPIEHSFGDWRPGDQRVFVANSTKAQRLLGWAPRISPGAGVPLLLEWSRSAHDEVARVVAKLSFANA